MSNTNETTSEAQKAAEQANAEQIKNNLDNSEQTDAAQSLSDEEKTPFIDDKERTDK